MELFFSANFSSKSPDAVRRFIAAVENAQTLNLRRSGRFTFGAFGCFGRFGWLGLLSRCCALLLPLTLLLALAR